MSLRDKLSISKDLLQIIIMLMFISFATLGIIWLGLGVWANISEGASVVPEKNADYSVLIKTTGEVLLTPSFDSTTSKAGVGFQVYTLHGFYHQIDGRWRWVKSDISLDEYYFGDIIINRRSNYNE